MYIFNELRDFESEPLPLESFRAKHYDTIKQLYDTFIKYSNNDDTGELFEKFVKNEHKIYLNNPNEYKG